MLGHVEFWLGGEPLTAFDIDGRWSGLVSGKDLARESLDSRQFGDQAT
jgi:hypothetical protein